MNYNKILKQIAVKENISEKEIENEMKKAITMAGYDCSVQEFIEMSVKLLEKDYI